MAIEHTCSTPRTCTDMHGRDTHTHGRARTGTDIGTDTALTCTACTDINWTCTDMHGLWHLNEHNIWANCGFLFQNVVYTLIWCCIWHWKPNKQVLRGCISKIFKILYSARTCHIELHGHVTENNLHGRGGTDTTDVPRTFYHAPKKTHTSIYTRWHMGTSEETSTHMRIEPVNLFFCLK